MFDPIEFSFEGDHYLLTFYDSHDAKRGGLEVLCTRETQSILARSLHREGTRRALRRRLGESSATGWSDHDNLTRTLTTRLSSDMSPFVLLRRPRPTRPLLHLAPPTEDLLESTAEALQQDLDAWIEVLVIDDEDEPCANLDYEIDLSDGRTRQGTTNEHGILRYEAIPDGTCSIRFTSLDAGSWDLA